MGDDEKSEKQINNKKLPSKQPLKEGNDDNKENCLRFRLADPQNPQSKSLTPEERTQPQQTKETSKKSRKRSWCVACFEVLSIIVLISMFITLLFILSGGKAKLESFINGKHSRLERRDNGVSEHQYYELEVPLNILYTGGTYNFHKERVVKCKECDGTGSKDKENHYCDHCHGSGIIMTTRRMGPMVFQQQERCPKCNGKGRFIEEHNVCPVCRSFGLHRKGDVLSIEIPPGLPSHQTITLYEKANEELGKKTGNLVCKIKEREHPKYKRVNETDLALELVISLHDALLGFKTEIVRLDETSFIYERKDVLQPDQLIVIENEGMPVYGTSKKGDLYLTFHISYPSQLTESEINVLKKVFAPHLN